MEEVVCKGRESWSCCQWELPRLVESHSLADLSFSSREGSFLLDGDRSGMESPHPYRLLTCFGEISV